MHTFLKEGVLYNFVSISDNEQCKDWIVKNFETWEPFTFECFRKVASPSKIAIDIGAWIGLTGIWLAKHFKHVVCVEADKLSLSALEANMNASSCDNYSLVPNAIYHTNTSLYFGPNSFRANSTLNESMSQLKSNSDKQDDYMVNTVTLNDIVKNIDVSDIGFIKVDIEGGEEHILVDLMTFSSKHKIPILLSFHISWWKDSNINRFVDLFKDCVIINDKTKGPITDLAKFLISEPFATILCM